MRSRGRGRSTPGAWRFVGFWLGVVLLSSCVRSPAAPAPPSPTRAWPSPQPYRTATATATTRPPSRLASPPPFATPSPTPRVYTIQPGDTLSALALRFGVSVKALLLANPGLNPNALPVGQTLTIPPSDAAGPWLDTDAMAQLELRGPWCYATRPWVCAGEVYNPGEEPIALVRVALTARTAAGWRRVEVDVPLAVIPGGARVPFAVSWPFAEPPEPPYALEVVRAYVQRAEPPIQVVQLPPEAWAVSPARAPSGHLQALAVRLALRPRGRVLGVLIAGYDAQDRVSALHYATPPATYPDGQAWKTALVPWDGASVARVVLWAETRP